MRQSRPTKAAELKREQAGRKLAERFAAASLETLLNAIDANDAETGAHVRRVAMYALILADEAGMSAKEKRSIERVALFHDVGKIHEALFDITHDDKALSAADRHAVHTHPERGATVLAPLNGFYPELPRGVLSHHEHWDGGGYPRGLVGRRIPLTARVVAIADTFDAITHNRRYQTGRSVQVARDAILAGRSTVFDPTWVDLFAFPPVFARFVATERLTSRWVQHVHQRRTGFPEPHAPDVSFRWHPGRLGGRGLPASDQPRKTAR